MSPSFSSWVEIVVWNQFQESLLCVAAGLTPGSVFLCPLAPRSVPYPRADVTIGNPPIGTKALYRCFKQPIIKTKYGLKRGCDQEHNDRYHGR
jgi:hypothetical protein